MGGKANLIVGVVIALTASGILAMDPSSDEFVATTYALNGEYTTAGNAVSMFEDGSFVLVFATSFANHRPFDESGVPLAIEAKIDPDPSSRTTSAPAVSVCPAGGFVTSYRTITIPVGPYGMRVRRYGAAGDGLDPTWPSAANTTDQPRTPVIASGPGCDYVLAWNEDGGGGVVRYDAFGQPLMSTVAPVGSDRTVSMNATGEFVIALADGDSSANGVYVQWFNANNETVGAVRANQVEVNDQVPGGIAMAADGTFLVVWASNGQDGSGWGVYGRRFANDGVSLGPEFRVNDGVLGNQMQPDVAMDSAGNAVVVWQSDVGDGDGNGVFVRPIRSNGGLGSQMQVNQRIIGDQDSPSVAMSDSWHVVVSWNTQDHVSGSSHGDVLIRLFDANSTFGPDLFEDGFESGDTLSWTGANPG